jgi:hypothetical protein
MISLLINPFIALILPMIATRPYLDPGSGSFILQILIATLVGSLFLIKVYWKKLNAFFKKTFSKGQNGEPEPGPEHEQEQE